MSMTQEIARILVDRTWKLERRKQKIGKKEKEFEVKKGRMRKRNEKLKRSGEMKKIKTNDLRDDDDLTHVCLSHVSL